MNDEILKEIEKLEELEKYEEIINIIENLQAEQLNTEIIEELARAYANIQKYEKAIEILKSIEYEGKNSVDWNYTIGYSYYYSKDYKNSENYKNMALTRKSKNGFFDKTCYCPHNGEYVNAIIGNNCNWQLHPKENRGLTISEMFALMGMPTDYEFLDNSKKLRDVFLVTQNVPVNSARYICKNILKYFNKSLNLGKKFIKQDNHLKKVDIFNY